MPGELEIKEKSEIHHFIDTNVVFDIIYEDRIRHHQAIEFYKKFLNLELCIETKVNGEGCSVILNYITQFSTDLNNYISVKNRHGKQWDELKPMERRKRLDDFLDEKNNQRKIISNDSLPFYKQMIQLMKLNSIDSNIIEFREILIDLPMIHLENFKSNLRSRFTMHYPLLDFTEEKVLKFNESLKVKLKNGYFQKEQSVDMEIVISLLQLIIFGNASDVDIKRINFYTNDIKMIQNYQNIRDLPPELESASFETMLMNGITSVSIAKPF